MNGYYNIFIDNKYTRWYLRLMDFRRQHPASHRYGEVHHIIPRCLFKIKRFCGDGTAERGNGWLSGDPDHHYNTVTLTRREHVLVHRMLCRMTGGEARLKMISAQQVSSCGIKNSRLAVQVKIENKKRQMLKDRLWREEQTRINEQRRREDKRQRRFEAHLRWMQRKGILLMIGDERVI
jgi:hypothetical protein